MLNLTPGRKLLLAFVIAFFVTNIPIVHVQLPNPPGAAHQEQAYAQK